MPPRRFFLSLVFGDRVLATTVQSTNHDPVGWYLVREIPVIVLHPFISLK